MSDEQAAQFNLEEIIGKYIDLRDAIERETKELAARLEPLKQAMKGIETFMMALANKTGQTKFGTPKGTAFVTTKTGCNVSDWEVALAFIRTAEQWNLLNHAVNKTAVGEYIEKTGSPPPGINWVAMKEIQIRRG